MKFDKEFFEGKEPFFPDGYTFVEKNFRVDVNKALNELSIFYIDTHIVYKIFAVYFLGNRFIMDVGFHSDPPQTPTMRITIYSGSCYVGDGKTNYIYMPISISDSLISLYLNKTYEPINSVSEG